MKEFYLVWLCLVFVTCWYIIRCCFDILLNDANDRRNGQQKGQNKERPSKISNGLLHLEILIRFLFCLPRENHQNRCESCQGSGYGLRSISERIKGFVLNVREKVFHGFHKIILGFNFGGFSFCHSNGKISEPISIYSYDRAPRYHRSDRSRACGKIPVLTRNFPGKVPISGFPRGRISARHSRGDMRTFAGLHGVFWRSCHPRGERGLPARQLPPAPERRPSHPATRVDDVPTDSSDGAADL
jgi:hypothetical protein